MAKTEVLPPQRMLPGRRKPVDVSKLERLKSAALDSSVFGLEQLLIFDARCLDRETKQELQRIVPELIRVRRAWKAEFLENGCIHCRRKDVVYGAGGFCGNCQARYRNRMTRRYKKAVKGRDIKAEAAALADALSLKYNLAQRLLNGED